MTGWINHWPTLSAPIENATLRVISHGGGVQTSALCLMAARGDVGPMPDCAIFADTGAEPQAVYDYLDYLAPLLPFPLVRLKRPGPSLMEHARANALLPLAKRPTIPLHTANPKGMMMKQCSTDWKTRVVKRAMKAMLRNRLGIAPNKRIPAGVTIEQWIGISCDEKERVRENSDRVIFNRYPLIESKYERRHCLAYLADRQYREPPRSACIFCPLRNNQDWRDLQESPADFAAAVEFDRDIRPGFAGMIGEAFVHQSRKPLDEIDFSRPDDERQGLLGFINDCSGMCGV